MKLMKRWLEQQGACQESIDWFLRQKETNLVKLVNFIIEKKDSTLLSWANWVLPRKMKYKQHLAYAIYAAEQIIKIYEKEYPNDKRPRKVIKEAKTCLENPSRRNRKTVAVVGCAAARAAIEATTEVAGQAAWITVWVAVVAAGRIIWATTWGTTWIAAWNAIEAGEAEIPTQIPGRVEIQIRILRKGIKLLEEKKNE